jgi:hypothetical protein
LSHGTVRELQQVVPLAFEDAGHAQDQLFI